MIGRCFRDLCGKYTRDGDPAPADNVAVSFGLIEGWAQQCGVPTRSLLDSLAIRLARGFAEGELTYGLGDAIANDLYGVCIDNRIGDFPAIFWSVFEAFDAGEFHRSTDKSDDPVLEHTMPMIRDLLASIDG